MRVSIVQEQRFIHLANGETYDDGHSTYELWQRYLSHFEEVQVIGRSRLVNVLPPGYRRVDGPGVKVFHLPDYHGPESFVLRVLPLLSRLMQAFEPGEAVILRVSGTLASLSAPLLRWRRQPFAVEVINDPAQVFSRGGVQHPLRRLFRWGYASQTRWQCRVSSASLYVTRRALQEAYPSRPGTPVFGVSDVRLPPEAYASARVYSGPGLRAVMVGSLQHWYKGPDIAIRALAQLRAQGLPVTLRIVGQGLKRPECEALARELGVEHACTFVGQRPTPEAVRRDLAQADLFVMPSRTEGLPRALVEAMAQGLPAVGSRVSGIPELLPEDALVTPGSAEEFAEVWGAWARDPVRLTAGSQRNFAEARTYAEPILSAERGDFLKAVRRATQARG
ncbi:glycosyltransferase family 4 protein [Deinococcus sp. SDU3-2]|uniref:Glycosyltransferase family 4 protein n=1 Tax=Deinococcus terrestris TaxID=2651870 RepID=A0A7X1NYY9_9DEIO|nr:glycosyltransferase [Deinococcus terrestris]MPY68378.1 glycosyltransferase family 4 protein [Deinococcus terrestris]